MGSGFSSDSSRVWATTQGKNEALLVSSIETFQMLVKELPADENVLRINAAHIRPLWSHLHCQPAKEGVSKAVLNTVQAMAGSDTLRRLLIKQTDAVKHICEAMIAQLESNSVVMAALQALVLLADDPELYASTLTPFPRGPTSPDALIASQVQLPSPAQPHGDIQPRAQSTKVGPTSRSQGTPTASTKPQGQYEELVRATGKAGGGGGRQLHSSGSADAHTSMRSSGKHSSFHQAATGTAVLPEFEGVPTLLVKVMQRYLEIVPVQLSLDIRSGERLAESGACQALALTLSGGWHDIRLQREGLQAAAGLADASTRCSQLLGQNKMCGLAIRALKLHGYDDSRLRAHAVATIASLASFRKHQKILRKCGACYLLPTILYMKELDSFTCLHCLRAMASLGDRNKSNIKAFKSHGVVDAVVTACRRFRDDETIKAMGEKCLRSCGATVDQSLRTYISSGELPPDIEAGEPPFNYNVRDDEEFYRRLRPPPAEILDALKQIEANSDEILTRIGGNRRGGSHDAGAKRESKRDEPGSAVTSRSNSRSSSVASSGSFESVGPRLLNISSGSLRNLSERFAEALSGLHRSSGHKDAAPTSDREGMPVASGQRSLSSPRVSPMASLNTEQQKRSSNSATVPHHYSESLAPMPDAQGGFEGPEDWPPFRSGPTSSSLGEPSSQHDSSDVLKHSIGIKKERAPLSKVFPEEQP